MASPFGPDILLKVATPVFNESQVAHIVKTCDAPFARIPVAANCWVVPGAMLNGDDGVIVIDETGDVERIKEPCMLPEAAVMVVVTVETMAEDAVASPFEPAILLMSTTDLFDVVQVTDDVMFWVLWFEYVPIAVNCVLVPGAMLGSAGVMERETSVAEVPEEPPPQPDASAERSTIATIAAQAPKLFFMMSLPGCFDAARAAIRPPFKRLDSLATAYPQAASALLHNEGTSSRPPLPANPLL